MKKHRKAVTLILLAIAACVILLAYMIISKNSDAPDNTETQGENHYILASSVADKTTALTYYADGTELSFVKTEDGWQYGTDAYFPLDTDKVDAMVDGISAIIVYKDIDSGDNGEYGFDSPSLTVKVGYDGGSAEYLFGDLNTFTGRRYLKTVWDGKVYLVDDDVTEYFSYTLSGLIKRDTIPSQITKTSIFSLALSDGEITNEISDETGVSALAAQFLLIGTGSVADYYADDDELAKTYMIGDGGTLTVRYYVTVSSSDDSVSSSKTEREYTIKFGCRSEDEVYFVLPESRIVYTLSYDTYSNIMSYITYYVTE